MAIIDAPRDIEVQHPDERPDRTVPRGRQQRPGTLSRRELIGRAFSFLGGAAAGGAAVEATQREEQRPQPEYPPRNPNILFLEGNHYDGDERREPSVDLQAGNLARNGWEQDQELLAQFREHQPVAVYADNASISLEKLAYYYKIPSLREWQPQGMYRGRPGVFIISGDNENSALLENPDTLNQEELRRLNSIKTGELGELYSPNDHIAQTVMGALLVSGTIADTPVRRRKFLAFIAGLAGGAAIDSLTQKIDQFFPDQQSMDPNTWLDGRDALASAKIEDGIQLLQQQQLMSPEAKSAILMGLAHGDNASLFMSNEGTAIRNQTILDFARSAVSIVTGVLQERARIQNRTLSQREIDHATAIALRNFASMRITHVSTPETADRIPGTELDQYVDDHVQFLGPATLCPSVVATISHLIPPNAQEAFYSEPSDGLLV